MESLALEARTASLFNTSRQPVHCVRLALRQLLHFAIIPQPGRRTVRLDLFERHPVAYAVELKLGLLAPVAQEGRNGR